MNLIDVIAKRYNLNQNLVYNAFVKNGTTKEQMEYDSYVLVYQIQNGYDIFSDAWTQYSSIKKALKDIKQLIIPNLQDNNNIKKEDNKNKNYTEKGVNVIKEIANKFNLNREIVSKQFVYNGVTAEEMDFISGFILEHLKEEGDFFRYMYLYESVNNALLAIKKIIQNRTVKTFIEE